MSEQEEAEEQLRHERRLARWTTIAAVISALTAAVTVGVTVWNNSQTIRLGSLHAAIEQQHAQIEDQAEQRARASSAREYNIKVYDKVFEWLDHPDKKDFLLALVDTVTNSAQQVKLIKLITTPPPSNDNEKAALVKRVTDAAEIQALCPSPAYRDAEGHCVFQMPTWSGQLINYGAGRGGYAFTPEQAANEFCKRKGFTEAVMPMAGSVGTQPGVPSIDLFDDIVTVSPGGAGRVVFGAIKCNGVRK